MWTILTADTEKSSSTTQDIQFQVEVFFKNRPTLIMCGTPYWYKSTCIRHQLLCVKIAIFPKKKSRKCYNFIVQLKFCQLGQKKPLSLIVYHCDTLFLSQPETGFSLDGFQNLS